MKAVGSLALGGVPELAVSDDKGHIFVNLEDKSEIVEFDAPTLKIIKRFSLAPGKNPPALPLTPSNDGSLALAPIGSWLSPMPTAVRSSRHWRSARAPTVVCSTRRRA